MPTDVFPVGWTECSLDGTLCTHYQATSSLPLFRDSGDLLFILAFILFFVSLPGIGMIFNSIFKRNR